MSGRRTDRTRQSGYFSPTAEEHNYLAFGGRVGLLRLLLRVAIAFALLFAVDAAVAKMLVPKSEYLHAYRLPRQLPTASIADYADAIDRSAVVGAGGPIVTFLGASPTYGYRIKDAANTYPYAFEASATASGWPSRAFNVASDGQFLADEYVIGKRLADDSDVVFVQLTYHTFNPSARSGAVIRYPELPKVLGVGLAAPAAEMLGVKSTPTANVTSRADAFVGKYWLLWRERDLLDKRFFGGKPQTMIAGTATASKTTSLSGEAGVPDDGFASFDSLEPGQQMIVISRYAENSRFDISPQDSEVRFLSLLADQLKAKGKKAVFFVAPLNRELIEEYELIDPKQYAANIGVLRGVVAARGFPFLDYNTGPDVLPTSLFADISHTTDEGGRRVGGLLWRDSCAYLRGSDVRTSSSARASAGATPGVGTGVKQP